jgi:CDP-diacylglycerol--serine O-phosphatidyltransferase
LAHLHQYNTIGLLISAFPLVFGAIRLARFNVQLVGFDKDYFTGLPIPHQALTVSAFFLAYDGQNGISGFASIMLAPLVVILGLLMVSRVKYDTLPKFTKREIRHHPWKTALYAIGTLIVIVSLGKLFFEVMLATVFIGIIRSFIHFFSKKQIEPQKEALEEREISSIDI